MLWFTGLSGSGKSTIANLVEKHAARARAATPTCSTATMSATASTAISASPTPTGWRTSAASAEAAKLMVDAGLIVLVSFISPFRAERRMARELLQPGEFIEVFVDTPLEVCMQRDPKGLYAKGASAARSRTSPASTVPIEAPEHPELRVDTTTADPAQLAAGIVSYLRDKGYVS